MKKSLKFSLSVIKKKLPHTGDKESLDEEETNIYPMSPVMCQGSFWWWTADSPEDLFNMVSFSSTFLF